LLRKQEKDRKKDGKETGKNVGKANPPCDRSGENEWGIILG
jgi:hypothetical protein